MFDCHIELLHPVNHEHMLSTIRTDTKLAISCCTLAFTHTVFTVTKIYQTNVEGL